MPRATMSDWRDRRTYTAWQHGHPREDAIEDLLGVIHRERVPKDVHIADGVKSFYRDRMTKAIYATGWDGTVRIRATSDGSYRVTTER